jgi:hypothetical protein
LLLWKHFVSVALKFERTRGGHLTLVELAERGDVGNLSWRLLKLLERAPILAVKARYYSLPKSTDFGEISDRLAAASRRSRG